MDTIVLPGPSTFQWESLGYNVVYKHEIIQRDCSHSYTRVGSQKSGNTAETQITVDLPPNSINECYELSLSAHRNGQQIGILITHAGISDIYGYRFRVQ